MHFNSKFITLTCKVCKADFAWWRGEDSNLRRRRRQIYSLLPLATREPLLIDTKASFLIPASYFHVFYGAGERT